MFNLTLWALGLLLALTQTQSLPYNPTTILLPSTSAGHKDIAYILLQNSDSDPTNQLLALNISSTLSASNLTFDVLDHALPFQTDGSTAIIPSIAASGEVLVYSGSCSTSTSAQLWLFSPNHTSTTGNGTWQLKTTTTASDVTSAVLLGADFLSGAFTFSPLVQSNVSETQLYIFGGMCPKSSANTSTWQSAASYSSHMLRLSPEGSTSYNLDESSNRGAPIAEAGFTVTGLTPTYSNGSVETQQQSFVLLGGHTQQAFINMSEVAIWSLPEEAWSFVTVDTPESDPKTDLTTKSVATSVDSRSGHTAVLTADGSQIVVFGGWVGDTSQAAYPQLAVLELGAGFGGNGDWSWTIPATQPSVLGIYGHGAVMLPGDIMMVLGGYNISASGTSKRELMAGADPLFFNVTASSWVTDYTNPAYAAAGASSAAQSSPSGTSNSTKIGLGVGLGLGIAALLIAALVFCWYSRLRRRRRIDEREKYIQSLSAGQLHFYSPTREMGLRSGGFPWTNNGWNRNNENNESEVIYDATSAVAGYENLDTGVHGLGDYGIPPVPKQVQRKNLHSRNVRGMYQPTSAFETNNLGKSSSLGTAGPIHPIYEADEEDHSRDQDYEVGVTGGEHFSAPSSANPKRRSDPFRDPAIKFSALYLNEGRRVATPEESPVQSREREIQKWVSDWAAADALLASKAKSHSSAGRVSPSRRAQLIAASNISSASGEEDCGRTASSLSERSIAISTMSISRSGSSSQSRSRSNSLRGFITNAINPFTSTILSTTAGSSTETPIFDRGQPPRSAGSSGGSFTTARSSFPAMQAEGESLLLRADGEYSREPSPGRLSLEPGSPSKSKPSALGRGRIGWLGSLRKAFVGDSPTGNTSLESFSYGNKISSPVRIGEAIAPSMEPRRTVSAGATLWRRKQGKSDWDDSADLDQRTPVASQRSNTFTGDLHTVSSGSRAGEDPQNDDDEEWDIERAIENRVVQVMFTVPKEKLRVVNHDFAEDRSETGSLRSKNGSSKSLRVVQTLLAVENALDADWEQEPEIESKIKGKEMDSPRGKVQEIVQKLEERTASPERL